MSTLHLSCGCHFDDAELTNICIYHFEKYANKSLAQLTKEVRELIFTPAEPIGVNVTDQANTKDKLV
jgi:hypothetical protein